jgi:hypothetical protein
MIKRPVLEGGLWRRAGSKFSPFHFCALLFRPGTFPRAVYPRETLREVGGGKVLENNVLQRISSSSPPPTSTGSIYAQIAIPPGAECGRGDAIMRTRRLGVAIYARVARAKRGCRITIERHLVPIGAIGVM